MKATPTALGVEVRGIVQGVGFRPFVYQLANKLALTGTVANSTTGVIIHIEGAPERIESFCTTLRTQCPPLSRITDIRSRAEALTHARAFTIIPSETQNDAATFVAPDVSVCDDCLGEMQDPRNRRFRYPFINCTNCGPRYTIIEDIPYDRPKTAMKGFSMCPLCRAEYEDPANRRFHAQPNACPDCGPQVRLFDNRRRAMLAEDPVGEAQKLLKEGYVLAVKGLGGFHLAVDAENEEAVQTLRKRKNRPDKPFALMSRDMAAVRRYAHLSPAEAALLTAMERPMVLLQKRFPDLLAEAVAPGNRYFGVMLPYTPLHHLLLNAAFIALIMTSGNRGGEPLCIDNETAFTQLSDIADYFLMHDRPIYQRNDDTLVQAAAGTTRFIRRARGYVPAPISLAHSLSPTLACGGELKNTLCLARDHHAIVSQHIGDMGALSSLEFFKETVDHLKKISKITPRIVAHDLHPDYLSTQYALGLSDVRTVAVQHHHAHVVSCMAEHHLDGPVIGLALDGTGFGPDGAVWGGEVLIAKRASFIRAAHLAYVPMPGGEAAIQAPWRMALSYLYHGFGADIPFDALPFLKQTGPDQTHAVLEILSKNVRSPATSSAGRLFDGISAMAGFCHTISFEGQAAMALEAAAGGAAIDGWAPYAWEIRHVGDVRQIGIAPMIRQVARDVAAGAAVGEISCRFHATLIEIFGGLCREVRKETDLNRVVMSGGVFQNKRLLEGLNAFLSAQGFEVYTHHKVPTNDGGLSLGQAVASGAMVAV
ncbi:MAG: carbamoyltransferase HypF [Desulfobacterales bacterium]|jgi:hydrogenase maturation protein HypF|nr:carbamoyltransferase HypF [Desulfobacterales bacterium]